MTNDILLYIVAAIVFSFMIGVGLFYEPKSKGNSKELLGK